MKITDITETTSGGIAVVAQPIGKMIKRPNPSVFSKKKKTEDITTLNTEPKLGKLPHEEVESVIHQWVNQEDHIELSNGMHVLSGENHGYADNVALIVDADYKILDHDDDIVELMQQFTAQEIDPSIVETIVEKCWKGYEKKGMKTMFGKRVPNCVKKEAVEEGKSPHKKGSAKYKKHMAAMHAEDVNDSGMIGEPDRYYDEEDRKEAYDQLQDALDQCDRYEHDYVMDGSCPACAGSGYMDGEETFINDDGEEEESSECDGFGNYGCDEGQMTYGNDTVKWKQIMDHDYNQEIKRERESKPQPSDEILVGAMKQLHKNYVETGRFNAMELPRILRQMYPEISKQKAREIGSKFFHSFRDMNDEMSEDYNPALVTMLAKFEDECAHYYRYYGDTDMITIDKLLKAGKAEEAAEEMAGAMSDSSGGSNDFDHIYDFAKDMVDDYLHEPAMAEMRKLAGLPETEVKERTYKDVGTADVVKDRRGKEFKFHKDAKQFKSVDGEVAGLNTKLGKDLLRIRRNQMKRTTPSYPGNK